MAPVSNLFEDGFALLIGVGYCTDPSLSLPGTVNDASELEKVLTDPGSCGYPPTEVSLLVNNMLGSNLASKNNILGGLQWLADNTTDTSTVIIYYSGHAKRISTTAPDHSKDTRLLYLIPGNCDLENLNDTAISMEELAKALMSIDAKKILIILDCCHAGGFNNIKMPGTELPDSFTRNAKPKHSYEQLSSGRGYAIMLSSDQDQSSWLMQ